MVRIRLRRPNWHVVYLVSLVVALFLVNLYWNSYTAGRVQRAEQTEVRNDDHQWCSALDVLTAHKLPYPADPKANPSRVESYQLQQDFLRIGRRFGC